MLLIKNKLFEQSRTNRWLWRNLEEQGFKMSEKTLNLIINNKGDKPRIDLVYQISCILKVPIIELLEKQYRNV